MHVLAPIIIKVAQGHLHSMVSRQPKRRVCVETARGASVDERLGVVLELLAIIAHHQLRPPVAVQIFAGDGEGGGTRQTVLSGGVCEPARRQLSFKRPPQPVGRNATCQGQAQVLSRSFGRSPHGPGHRVWSVVSRVRVSSNGNTPVVTNPVPIHPPAASAAVRPSHGDRPRLPLRSNRSPNQVHPGTGGTHPSSSDRAR